MGNCNALPHLVKAVGSVSGIMYKIFLYNSLVFAELYLPFTSLLLHRTTLFFKKIILINILPLLFLCSPPSITSNLCCFSQKTSRNAYIQSQLIQIAFGNKTFHSHYFPETALIHHQWPPWWWCHCNLPSFMQLSLSATFIWIITLSFLKSSFLFGTMILPFLTFLDSHFILLFLPYL